MRAGTDALGCSGIDQFLIHPLPRQAELPHAISGVQSQSSSSRAFWDKAIVCSSLCNFLVGFSRSLTRWPLNVQEAGPDLHHSSGRVRLP